MSVTKEINNNTNTFNPLQHRPPKYDIFGHLVNIPFKCRKKPMLIMNIRPF
jgi:hypothetical protein